MCGYFSVTLSLFVTIFLLLSYPNICDGTLSKNKSSKKEKKAVDQLTGPSKQNVFEKSLVQKSIKANEVLKHHASYDKDVKKIRFQGDILGYVTPWNSHGYDIAKIFSRKFSHISPVWLQIKRYHGGRFNMEGGHDIDRGWIKEVRKANKDVLFVPRILFDGWSLDDFHVIFSSQESQYEIIAYIIGYIEEHQFNGIVLEIWMQFGGDYRSELRGFVSELGQAMVAKQLKLILVIPPPLYRIDMRGMFSKEDFDILSPVVDAFSLMTYDYPNHGSAGAIAPYEWVKACVMNLSPPSSENGDRSKILLGLNFYGMNYKPGGGTPLVGNTYLQILNNHRPKLIWNNQDKEHKLEYK